MPSFGKLAYYRQSSKMCCNFRRCSLRVRALAVALVGAMEAWNVEYKRSFGAMIWRYVLMSKGREKFINLSPDYLADLQQRRMSTGCVDMTFEPSSQRGVSLGGLVDEERISWCAWALTSREDNISPIAMVYWHRYCICLGFFCTGGSCEIGHVSVESHKRVEYPSATAMSLL